MGLTTSIEKLVRISGQALSDRPPDVQRLSDVFGENVARQLIQLLAIKNGFYAFEGALHVLPDIGIPPERGLLDWNAGTSWRKDYAGMADNAVFFAEDAFGVQFCIQGDGVSTFDPETGAFATIAADLEHWAEEILGAFAVLTGHPVIRAWQMRHGPLPAGARLVPIIPFVMGGAFDETNMRAVDATKGMSYRASIAVQIRDLPDGTRVKVEVVE